MTVLRIEPAVTGARSITSRTAPGRHVLSRPVRWPCPYHYDRERESAQQRFSATDARLLQIHAPNEIRRPLRGSRRRLTRLSGGSSHYWARRIASLGHEVHLLPAQYVRAYVKRNKTDEADAAALVEAARCADIRPVPVKTIEQQQIQALHRLRSQWLKTRLRYINLLRGILREFGVPVTLGVKIGKTQDVTPAPCLTFLAGSAE